MNDDGSLVRLEQIHKWFGTLHVLKGIDFAIEPGHVVTIIGPSGSGKSTLLRSINMLEEPTQGKVFFDGREITDVRTNLNKVRTEIGIVFQSFNLFPHKSALENITMALEKVLKVDSGPAKETSPGATREGRPCSQGGRLSGSAFGRSAAAGRHRQSLSHEAETHAVR